MEYKRKQYFKEYYQKNRKKKLKYSAQYRQKNRKKCLEICMRYHDRNKSVIAQVKQIGCYFCSELDADVLEFAHVDLKDVSINYNYGFECLIKEIEKCEIMCANCHIRFDLKKLQL